MTYLDYLFTFLVILSMLRGWGEGLVRSLAGISTIVISYLGAFFYFHKKNDWVTSFFIAILCALILEFIVTLLFKLWNKFSRTTKPTFLSSLLGGVIGGIWATFLLGLLLLFLINLNLNFPLWKEIQGMIKQSKTFYYASLFKEKSDIQQDDIDIILQSINDPNKLKSVESTPEYQTLIQDPKIQAVLSDETTQRQIQEHQIFKLLANPKFQAILKDKKLVNQFLDLEMMAIKKGIQDKDKKNDIIEENTEDNMKPNN